LPQKGARDAKKNRTLFVLFCLHPAFMSGNANAGCASLWLIDFEFLPFFVTFVVKMFWFRLVRVRKKG
jgi:hypothetical protein